MSQFICTERLPDVEGIERAAELVAHVAERSPLQKSDYLSELFEADIWLKREDLQSVRSYKLRGAYNFLSQINDEQRAKGVVCASAGNHAQGFALSCRELGIKGTIFMPQTTPKQKVGQVKYIGREHVNVVLHGDTYDDARDYALQYKNDHQLVYVPAFDHPLIIEGQGTVGKEILEQFYDGQPDIIFMPVGGGGLSSGCALYIKEKHPQVKLIGAEPQGAPAMYNSIREKRIVELAEIDSFVDGAAVKKVGEYTYNICSQLLDDITLVHEGRICTYILNLYNRSAIVAEPAGVLSVAAMDNFSNEIKGKKVVCIISGGNNDINRMPLIKEKSLLFEGLKHYFVITFPQRSGALKEFVNEVLGPTDDITLFEYTKKNSKESGPALVGIELRKKEDYQPLIERMKEFDVRFTNLNDNPTLFNFLI
ncbi:MAG: threonine ammonia-lyase [Bacteroidetes bacterium]|nr:threonine ammonia-lyase [Bacteroidota bacterium]